MLMLQRAALGPFWLLGGFYGKKLNFRDTWALTQLGEHLRVQPGKIFGLKSSSYPLQKQRSTSSDNSIDLGLGPLFSLP